MLGGYIIVENPDALKRLDTYIKRLQENDPSLTELCLDNIAFHYVRPKALAEALKTNTSLTELYLIKNNSSSRMKYLGDPGAKALAEALKTNISLTQLSLGNNEITHESAKALDKAIQENEYI
ncbi:MAG: hypothetical protein ACK5WS_02680 [Alphaproteobacteria bacterium]|jgi:hypothetical protein|nr:hypothetical protein [Candidatus Jidaibacter sp.]